MDKTSDGNMDTLKEMLLDEEKLITYVSLSKELCVHVNESKSLLAKIVDYVKKNHPDININVNYIISGLSEENKALTTVCTEAEVDNVSKTLKTIFFQHIYSVAKGSPAVDNIAYIAINKFEDFPLCTGLIRSNLCVKRTSDEIGNLKSNSQEIVAIDTKPVVPLKKLKEENKDVKKESGVSSDGTVRESKSEPIIKQEKSPMKTNNKNNKSQKGIAGFFNKTNNVAKKSKSDNNKNTVVSIKTEKENSENSNVKTEESVMDNDIEVKDIDNECNKKVNQENKTKIKAVTVKKKNAKVDKKRKRLLHISDSENEDEKNDPFVDDTPVTNEVNLESDDEIPPTPANNTVKITSGIVNPKKKRKIVDKTYTDEDGYILTKKEEVYESCSENEEVDAKENIQKVNEVSPKKNNITLSNKKTEVSPNNKKIGTKVSKKKISPPQKGKQATLMNFFKKV
ncbi:uncharacterized protein ACR2FA_011932 [Aphomia sociella]